MLRCIFAVNREKVLDIKLLRGVAASAVVLIHLLNVALINIEKGAEGYWFYRITHSFLQFAVPCFVFISSIVLAYSFKDKPLKVLPYYWKKIKRILFPYFMWSLMYLLGQVLVGYLPVYKLFKPSAWLYWLAYGKAYTHLYFMSVILQFYIVAPVLVWGMKLLCKYIKKHQVLVVSIVAVAPQIAIYWINRIYIYSYFKSTATLLPWYWCLCICGLWIGLNYSKWKEIVSKYIKRFSVIGVLGVCVYGYFQYALYLHGNIDTFLYQMVWYWYVGVVSIGGLYVLGEMQLSKILENYLLWISEHSFCIYLLHPVLTFLCTKIITTSNPWLLGFVLGVSFVIITILCGMASYIIQRVPVMWVLLGEKRSCEITNKGECRV